eukprot:2920720-Prymnesium_polylepis.1
MPIWRCNVSPGGLQCRPCIRSSDGRYAPGGDSTPPQRTTHSGCAHTWGGDAGGSISRDERGTRLRGPARPSSNPVHITGR